MAAWVRPVRICICVSVVTSSGLVKDGFIEKMFVERDGFEAMPVVSSAETMLNDINPEAEKPEQMAVLLQMWRTMLSV